MKIIHISDLHFGMHNVALVEPFLACVSHIKPDIILISGDLTQRALSEQYKQASVFLKNLSAPTLIVPGNHDIPFYNLASRLLHPFKRFKQYISPEIQASFINHEVNILGVNSANPYEIKDGRLSPKTLLQIKNHFSSSSAQVNILFFHHNLHYFSGMHQPLRNAQEFISYLQQSPIHIVCTGHLHYANLKLINKIQNKQCALLHAGSLFSPRTKDGKNSFYLIDTDHLRCRIDWQVFTNNTFSSHQTYELDFSAD